jgi:transcriptional regulator with XRE-family HTH domain
MKSSIRNDGAKTVRDISYYRQRYKNRFHAKLVSWINETAQRDHVTQKDIAERLNKDPAAISRLLSEPSNLTLETVSDILLAFDAEAEPPEIIEFRDRRPANYVHPLIARVTDSRAQIPPLDFEPTGIISKPIPDDYPKPIFNAA